MNATFEAYTPDNKGDETSGLACSAQMKIPCVPAFKTVVVKLHLPMIVDVSFDSFVIMVCCLRQRANRFHGVMM